MPHPHQINPRKLLHSKWTAVSPQNLEKHFLVVELFEDDEEVITGCLLEAIINQRQYTIDWRDLRNANQWHQGWK